MKTTHIAILVLLVILMILIAASYYPTESIPRALTIIRLEDAKYFIAIAGKIQLIIEVIRP